MQEGAEKAARTSGQRGIAARKDLRKLEAALANCCVSDTEDVEAEIQKALTRALSTLPLPPTHLLV